MRRRPLLLAAALPLALGLGGVFHLVQPVLGGGAMKGAPAVSAERLEAHVRALSEEFVPRDHAHPHNMNRAAAYIFAELKEAGGRVSVQDFEVRGTTYRNVVASFGPEEGARIVVGAHYDAAGPFPAADDNASGVAGLIELAGLLGRESPRTRVDLVAWALEEPPFFQTRHMGSVAHAESLRRAGVRVRVAISLEMIGFFSDAPGSQRFPLGFLKAFYPSAGNFISVVGKLGQAGVVRRVKKAMRGASPLGVHSINAPRWVPGVDFSDHASYWDAGYPALMITDTAFYRNPWYHTARDTAETLDYARMAMVVQGVHAAVLRFA